MSHTLTIRLTSELAEWIADTAKKTGVPRGKLIRDHLDSARSVQRKTFMRWAGSVSGPRDLSSRKGFSRS